MPISNNDLYNNILVVGLLSTGSSALVDILSEYDNINTIQGEFNDYRAPGLVADQLCEVNTNNIYNHIKSITTTRKKLGIAYRIIPVLNLSLDAFKGIRKRYCDSSVRIKQLNLLSKLNSKLVANIPVEEKIRCANDWIKSVGNIREKKNSHVLFNQPLLTSTNTNIWKQVFDPYKLIIVYRNPRDQLADIIKNDRLYAAYGAPYVNYGGVTLETIFGRSREGALNMHIAAIQKRYDWIDSLKKDIPKNNFLLLDFEGLVNDYERYLNAIENFIGGIKSHHKRNRQYFNPDNAKKSIGIYNQYLTETETEFTEELMSWYKKTLNSNNIIA